MLVIRIPVDLHDKASPAREEVDDEGAEDDLLPPKRDAELLAPKR